MKRSILFAAAAVLIGTAAQVIRPEIHTIDHITKVASYIRYDGPLTLVCFDIDETLLYPLHPEARDAWFGEQVTLRIKKGKTPDEAVRETLVKQIAAHRYTQVCQADWDEDELITALKKRGVHVICVTARSISFVDITYRQLQRVRIDLRQETPWNRCYLLKNLPKPAHYVPGILFCAGNDKGSSIEQLIDQLKYKPSHIVMVDDTRKHIEAVERMTKRRGISYDGFVIDHTWHKRLPCNILTDGKLPERPGIKRANN